MSQSTPTGDWPDDLDLDAPVVIDPPVIDDDDEGVGPAAVIEGLGGDVPVDVETLIVELETLTKERDELRDRLLRAAADFDNFRKRSIRERQDAGKSAVGRFVESLLPTLDACDAAVAHGDVAVEPIARALLDALGKQGLTVVGEVDEPFDPTWHEAVLVEPGNDGEQVVLEVLRRGYRWDDRVLRAAMVKVSG